MIVACVVALASVACTRDGVDKSVDRVTQGTHRVADKVEVSLHNAKDEAEHLKDKLPPADKVKAELKQMSEDARDKLRTADKKLKTASDEARASLRQRVGASK
jgi:predicted  nucleic acid-binding Zn-ribbon protein